MNRLSFIIQILPNTYTSTRDKLFCLNSALITEDLREELKPNAILTFQPLTQNIASSR